MQSWLLLCAGWGSLLVLTDVGLSVLSVVLYVVGTYFPLNVSVTLYSNTTAEQQVDRCHSTLQLLAAHHERFGLLGQERQQGMLVGKATPAA